MREEGLSASSINSYARALKGFLAKVKDYLSDSMTVEKAGKSESVRICVSPVWFENRIKDKVREVDEALAALMELYQLSRTLVKQGGIHL